jgi:type 2 lantibiotic biosynthesis protein LanM
LGQLQSSSSNEQYQDFVKGLTTGGLLPFFQKYSVMARLVAIAIDFWVEATAEFFDRLESDMPTIQQTFLGNTGQVVAVDPFLSDSHNRGRSVISLTFASGLKLVYKPKNLALEVAYFKLLNWCNQQKTLLPWRLLKVINCTTHGWVEYVEHLPCENEAAVCRHYQRAGMLLCLIYVLGGNDCHQENLIASGEHPMLIDLETLLYPHVPNFDSAGQEKADVQVLANQQFFEESVLRVGMLPRWDVKEKGQVAYDVSGLGGVGEQQMPSQMPKWRHINTDNMVLVHESGTMTTEMQTRTNAPLLNNTTLSPNNYVDEIVDGFQQMYQFLMEKREVLLLSDSPLAALAHQRIRFIFRNTEVYGGILLKTLHPNFLQNGIDRSIEIETLKRALLTAETKPSAWSLLAEEQQSLEQLDFPYFLIDSDGNTLVINSDQVVNEYFKESSYDRVVANLQQLNDQNLSQQISIIRASLCLRFARKSISTESSKNAKLDPNLNAIASLTQSQMVQEAVEIAQELQKNAIYGADGSVTWIGMEYIQGSQRLQLQPLGYDLYDGVCGVALFLAALSKITGNRKFQELALGALRHLKKTLHDTESKSSVKTIDRIGIGGATGIGSIIYSLVRIGQFLNEPDLLNLATIAASRISQESIASDRQFDLMAGTGGTILGLLALYHATLKPDILEQAAVCGYYLMKKRVASESTFRTWSTLDNKLLTGFSHGAAGISYALLRLYKATQDSIFLEGAEEAIAYERSVFSTTEGNWPDLRAFVINNGKSSYMNSWCHGAAGIGLARLGSLMILDTAEIRHDIAVALKTTQQIGLQNLDRVCCGNFGRLETLLVAASELSRPELLETAQRQASQLVARSKQAGSFYLFSESIRDVYNPGFFQGTAGIGYELLRLSHSDLLPSVLLLE